MVELEKLLAGLVRHEVEFVVIGGVAAVAHGSAYVTYDLDFCYSRDAANHWGRWLESAPLHRY